MMGMRCSQPQGLPVQAEEFLAKNAVKINECPHCHRHDGYRKQVISQYGMFDELPLYRYILRGGGNVSDEYVQVEIWDSGPIIWLGLKLTDGTKIQWPQEIIDQR